MKFDENGRRSEIEIKVSSLTPQGLITIATWSTENGIMKVDVPPSPPIADDVALSLRNRTFIVLIALVNENSLRLYSKPELEADYL